MDHSEKDCLLVAVMTHGEENNLLHAFDSIYSLEQITSAFSDEYCPSLRGKPRLFFFQACRGEKFDSGFKLKLDDDDLNRRSHTLNRAITSESLDITTPYQETSQGTEDLFFSPPIIHRDFLIVRSTMSKHFSFRNPKTGSWFIQALCDEIETNGETHDILNLLTHTNWKVSERESEGNSGPKSGNKQTTCTSSMLTKILILNRQHSTNF